MKARSLFETSFKDKLARDPRLSKMLAIAMRHDRTIPMRLQARLGPRPSTEQAVSAWTDLVHNMLANSGHGDLTNQGFEEWLARLYANGAADYEDMHGEGLDALGTWKMLSVRGLLRPEHQDFNRMRSLHQLNNLRNDQRYRQEIDRIKVAAELEKHRRTKKEVVLIDDDRFLVIVPMNWGACYTFNMQTGHRSSFCTGGSGGLTWFNNYAPKGMIVSVADKHNIDHKDGKWQFHAATNQIVNSQQDNRSDTAGNDARFAELFPGLMKRIVAAIGSHADEIVDASREVTGNQQGYDIADNIDDIKRKFPASWASEPTPDRPAPSQPGPAALAETITDDPDLNAEIERRLAQLPSDQRTTVLDALEVLMLAKGPISVADWAAGVREINQDPSMQMGEILKAAARNFPMVVSRVAPKTYQWHVVRSGSDEIIEPELQARMGQQVDIVSSILKMMRDLPQWTIPRIAAQVSLESDISQQSAIELVKHVVSVFGSMLDHQNGVYRFRQQPGTGRQDTMDLFRRLARRHDGNAADPT